MFAKHFLLIAGLLLVASPASPQELLDPEVAFQTTAKLIKPNLIEVRYLTAPGYYLYRDRLSYRLEPVAALLGKPRLPAGKTKHDEFLGKQVIYRKLTIVTLPLSAAVEAPVTLTTDLQGCADLGVCYPPVRRKFTLSPSTSLTR